jgi:hypothetical protein
MWNRQGSKHLPPEESHNLTRSLKRLWLGFVLEECVTLLVFHSLVFLSAGPSEMWSIPVWARAQLYVFRRPKVILTLCPLKGNVNDVIKEQLIPSMWHQVLQSASYNPPPSSGNKCYHSISQRYLKTKEPRHFDQYQSHRCKVTERSRQWFWCPVVGMKC